MANILTFLFPFNRFSYKVIKISQDGLHVNDKRRIHKNFKMINKMSIYFLDYLKRIIYGP